VLSGELILVTDEGEQTMRAGDCAGFKAGERNGHCLQNRTSEEAMFLPDRYRGGGGYVHKDGTPY
jgi:uncharacterized cupin superfamily protein